MTRDNYGQVKSLGFRRRSGAFRINRSLSIIALVALSLVLGACATGTGPGFFPPISPTDSGREVRDGIYPIVFWIGVGVFVLIEGLVIWVALRYRRKKGDDSLPTQTHGNNLLEIVWTTIPALIVLGLFIMTVSTLNKVEARTENPDVTVDVTGFQWQWTFEYPEEQLSYTGLGKEGPEMVVPTDEQIRIRLHATDVIHSFYVPEFLYKKDVVPGHLNEFEVVIREPGTYAGQCAEFCGLAHADMFFTVRAVPRAEYDAWVAAEQEAARATPTPAPSGGDNGKSATVQISASNAASFDQSAVTAPADTPLTIEFVNNDAPTVPHNVAITDATPEGDFIGMPLINGGESITYSAPPLPAGEYTFYCSVHPNMVGTLTTQ